jgi:DsbC/DsbD-like thiol-disulfide interchange protein
MVFLLLLGMTSCARETPNNNAAANAPSNARNSVDVVKATPQPIEAKRNETLDATVDVTVESGYHVNANPPTFPYLKPTELLIEPPKGVSVAFIVYPDPLTKTFPFADKPLAVYEGTIPIKIKLKVDKTAPAGKQTISAKLNVQACDDQVCYAPGTIDVSIPLDIK